MNNYNVTGIGHYDTVTAQFNYNYQEKPMSQLDRIYALLDGADPGLLQHVQERVNELLVGAAHEAQGTSGSNDSPAAHEDDIKYQAEYQKLQDELTPEERVADSPASTLSTVRDDLPAKEEAGVDNDSSPEQEQPQAAPEEAKS